ncbi:MAG TPA: hypothetical protein PLS65_09570, partial [Ferruginibacter sp.]|nr:hypothetical protein [Ferruginibacter sp.]
DMKKLCTFGLLLMLSCSAPKSTVQSNRDKGDTRSIPVELLDDNTYLLTVASDDKTYGYDKLNAVKVGGAKGSSGPSNERRFLNALLGPNGETVKYFRAGSCCAFKTPNGMLDNTGLLDRYRVSWVGSTDTVDIYLNMYDKGDLLVPVGFTAKKK